MAMIVNSTTIDAAIGGAEICLHELQSAATTFTKRSPQCRNRTGRRSSATISGDCQSMRNSIGSPAGKSAKKYWNTTNTSGNRKTDGIGVDFLKRKGSIDYGRY